MSFGWGGALFRSSFLILTHLTLFISSCTYLCTGIVRDARNEVVFSMKTSEPFVDDGASIVTEPTLVTTAGMIQHGPQHHGGLRDDMRVDDERHNIASTSDADSIQGRLLRSGSDEPSIAEKSRRLSELMHVLIDKEKGENCGILLKTKDIPNQRVLFVSHISADGPFADTPLTAGDIILSINRYSFHHNADANMALSVIDDSEDTVEIIARRSKESLRDFLLMDNAMERQPVSKHVHRLPPTKVETEFDEESYGASISGYNAARRITILKKHPMDRIGVKLKRMQTEWGAVLVVSKIDPKSPIDGKDIKVGDIIVAVNDISFRDEPIPERAAKIIQFALREVTIEYQKKFKPAVPPARPHRMQVTETVLPNGRTIVKTETFDAGEKSIGIKIEEVQVPIRSSGSDDVSALASNIGFSTVTNAIPDNGSVDDLLGEYQSRTGSSKGSEDVAKVQRQPPVPRKGNDTMVLTVRKKKPSQEVGISMGTTKGSLYITRVSPTGLFAGKPILPGDKVISINNESFRENPVLKDAFAIILNSPDHVAIEIQKTTLPSQTATETFNKSPSLKKERRRFGDRMFGPGSCFQKHDHDSSEVASVSKRNTAKGSTPPKEPSTPDTSLDVESLDPFYV